MNFASDLHFAIFKLKLVCWFDLGLVWFGAQIIIFFPFREIMWLGLLIESAWNFGRTSFLFGFMNLSYRDLLNRLLLNCFYFHGNFDTFVLMDLPSSFLFLLTPCVVSTSSWNLTSAKVTMVFFRFHFYKVGWTNFLCLMFFFLSSFPFLAPNLLDHGLVCYDVRIMGEGKVDWSWTILFQST